MLLTVTAVNQRANAIGQNSVSIEAASTRLDHPPPQLFVCGPSNRRSDADDLHRKTPVSQPSSCKLYCNNDDGRGPQMQRLHCRKSSATWLALIVATRLCLWSQRRPKRSSSYVHLLAVSGSVYRQFSVLWRPKSIKLRLVVLCTKTHTYAHENFKK